MKSTGRDDEYRRIGQIGIRENTLPDKEAVGRDFYFNTMIQNEAYDEVIKAKWKRRTAALF